MFPNLYKTVMVLAFLWVGFQILSSKGRVEVVDCGVVTRMEPVADCRRFYERAAPGEYSFIEIDGERFFLVKTSLSAVGVGQNCRVYKNDHREVWAGQ